MTRSIIVLLLAVPAAANPAAMSSTLEALRSQGASDPAALTAREGASANAGKTFDQSFTIQTLAPVEYSPLNGAPGKNPPPQSGAKPHAGAPAPVPAGGAEADYHFEGQKPLNGITIYTPVKGQGTTSGGASPTDQYGKYGKYALYGGLGIGAVGLALGAPLAAVALLAGLLVGAGAVLSFIFGGKKK